MKAYSMDLRERVLKDSDAGIRTRDVAVKYAVRESWVRRLKQRRRENGETAPRSSRNRLQPKGLPYAKRLQEWVQEKPDITLRELRTALGQAISLQTLSRALRQLQLTFKKKWSTQPNKIGPTCKRDALGGKPRGWESTRDTWSSSTKPEPTQRGRVVTAALDAGNA